MNIEQIVIDASAALKWRLRDEEATEQADAILNDFLNKRLSLIVPTLFDYEITNALKIAVVMRRLNKEDALSAIADFQQFALKRTEFSQIQTKAFEMAYRYQRSVYDSTYLALAFSQKILFYTGDRRLFNAVGQTLTWVKWIGDYEVKTAKNV